MYFLTVLSIIFPVFAITGLGYGYGRVRRPDMSAVNQLNLAIFVPALILHALSDKSTQVSHYLPLAAAGALVVLGSGLLIWPICRLIGADRRTFIPPMMFNNSGNIFIPVAILAFGAPFLPLIIVLFLVEMVLHFTVGLYIIDRHFRMLNLLRMPMILAMILGLFMSFSGLHLPPSVDLPIKMLGDVSIPLLLFALGTRLTEVSFRDWKLGLWSALLCPLSGLVMAAIANYFLPLSPVEQKMVWIFGSLPPAVLNQVVAETYQREVEKTASIVMLGNLGGLFVVPLVIGLVLH